MSHFTKVELEIQSEERLGEALEALGYEVLTADERGPALVRGWNGTTTAADVVARDSNSMYDYGFVRIEDEAGVRFDVVADWYFAAQSQPEFLGAVRQEYAAACALHGARQGRARDFNFTREVQPDGTIVLIGTR